MVELFGSSKANISEHITNIYQQGELVQTATVRKFRTVRKEGNRMVTRNMDYYNLDMIISVGFHVNSHQGIESHDRWLIIDDSLYHCGHSLNANGGHKISAITLMGTSPEVILSKVE